ncbi:hypothetical protein OIDMADRAFT_60307 [Oidiodendron maius Zn]|uniref:Carrier domain-containing protein n=1 Tax=Oidiodendron maius (strain Zn) TaxID=913774 RepID=A0A0C3C8D4_OIDMZ|nr:hypothetical protein OIDMADRAFT_60307 [Oidiodendron maius Zn]
MEQVSNVTTLEEAFEVLTAKLRAMLQLSDQVIDRNAPLIKLGIDSLVAVQVRSWFLKELKVDMPVLKLLGRAPLANICK